MRVFEFSFAGFFRVFLSGVSFLGVMGRHLSGRGRMWWGEKLRAQEQAGRPTYSGKGDDQEATKKEAGMETE